MIPEETKNIIIETANLESVAQDFYGLKKTGKSWYTECPKCGKKGKAKGLIITPEKDIYKCFSCDFSGKGSVNFLMETQNKSYPEALKYIADKYKILIQEQPKPKGPQKPKSRKRNSFCDMQLKSSGLTIKDITATTYVDEKTEKRTEVYVPGTRDQFGRIDTGDDMIIWYYDLLGKPVMFKKPKSSKFEHLYRIRWQVPEHHLDRNGKPIKYQSPSGSGSHLFIPETIRQIYKDRRVIKRLYIQEGEKKADKACIHGIPSVGIMGIHNIASQGRLPNDLHLIVQACKVEEVIFVLDSDWDHLSDNLKPGDRVDQRTASFYRAVINFRDYLKAFNNHGLYLDTYFGYIRKNENNDKGIDDLLTNTLKTNELSLRTDIEKAINDIKENDGEGEYVQLHKISTLAEYKIMQLWGFENSKTFLKKHKATLLQFFPNGEIFKIGKVEWRWDEEKDDFEHAQPITVDEQYWEKITWEGANGNEKVKFQFDYVNMRKFLRNRGYGKILMADNKDNFIHNQGKVVKTIEAREIKDYIIDFTEQVASKDVQNMILRGGKQFLGPENLSNMYRLHPVFQSSDKYSQHLYFQDKFWKITAKGIEEQTLINLENSVWYDKIIDFDAKKTDEPLLKVDQVTEDTFKDAANPELFKHFIGQYDVQLTNTGKKSHFMKFLLNTSEFAWRKMLDQKTRKTIPDTRTFDEKFETNMHFMSKLTAIGYLLHEYIDNSYNKMIIAMDGRMSEVGQSNGRSGKSLLGVLIGKLISQVYINGKQKNLTEDQFLMEGVTEKTKNVFIDDPRANIDIEFFFPHLTGQFMVRGLGQAKFNLPDDQKPKFYVPTNHGINDNGGSLRDRVFLLAFSDFYGEHHKPIHDFGMNFFIEWKDEPEQWNLTYNMAATCIQLYLEHGLVNAPLRRLELRNLRQKMGETFLEWADTYFSNDTSLNQRLVKSEVYNDYENTLNQNQKRYLTSNSFKTKIKAFCEYRGYSFNKQLFDENGHHKKFDNKGKAIDYDKSGGIEYITISNT